MSKNGIIAGVVVLLAIVIGVVFITNKADAPTSELTNNTNSSTVDTSSEVTEITYTNNGFSPNNISVKTGDTITVKNNSSRVLQFDSSPHPEHTDNPELNVGTISPGKSKNFKVSKSGSHGFHNHSDSGHTGILVVE